jgi:fatty-acyl-CoA synthase
VLLPLYRQFAAPPFERVIVFPFSGAPVRCVDGAEAPTTSAAGRARPVRFDYAPHDEDDPVAMCYTSGTTGRPKGVVYSHRSTCCTRWWRSLPDFWGLSGATR